MNNFELRLMAEYSYRQESLQKSQNINGKKYLFKPKKSMLSIFSFLSDNEIDYLYKITK